MALVAALEENYDLELQNKANLRTVSLNKTFIGNPGSNRQPTTAALHFAWPAHSQRSLACEESWLSDRTLGS